MLNTTTKSNHDAWRSVNILESCHISYKSTSHDKTTTNLLQISCNSTTKKRNSQILLKKDQPCSRIDLKGIQTTRQTRKTNLHINRSFTVWRHIPTRKKRKNQCSNTSPSIKRDRIICSSSWKTNVESDTQIRHQNLDNIFKILQTLIISNIHGTLSTGY